MGLNTVHVLDWVNVFIFSLVKFHPDPNKLQLFSAAGDCKIRLWDLTTSKCVFISCIRIGDALGLPLKNVRYVALVNDYSWEAIEHSMAIKPLPIGKPISKVFLLVLHGQKAQNTKKFSWTLFDRGPSVIEVREPNLRYATASL